MPVTYPVTGTVFSENGKPYPGGALELRPESNEDITVLGDIEKDGTFRLRTIKGSRPAQGAPAGTYEVTIAPAIGPDQKAPFAAFTLPKKYQVEAKENHWEIRADPPVR